MGSNQSDESNIISSYLTTLVCIDPYRQCWNFYQPPSIATIIVYIASTLKFLETSDEALFEQPNRTDLDMSSTQGPGGDAGALNYTVLVPIDYDSSTPTGGNSLNSNLNIHYEVCNFTDDVQDRDTDVDIYSLVISHGCSHPLRWCCS